MTTQADLELEWEAYPYLNFLEVCSTCLETLRTMPTLISPSFENSDHVVLTQDLAQERGRRT